MKLLDHPISQTCWRTRIAASIKGIELDLVPVDLLGGETTGQSYSALNPQKLVPALISGAEVIGQSLAIIDYFEQIKPDPSLYPDNPKLRARMLSLVNLLASDVAPLAVIRVVKQLEEQFGADAEAQQAFRSHWYMQGFASAEKLLAEQNSRYAFTDEVSLADVTLIPAVFAGRRFGADTSGFPRIEELYAKCMTLPAFLGTAPEGA
ncbi:MAG: maleylacetoacetate isomerase [Alphaproteobacteria bacterium]